MQDPNDNKEPRYCCECDRYNKCEIEVNEVCPYYSVNGENVTRELL